MADNVNITEGTGSIISADEVTRDVAGEKMQIIKIGLGDDGLFDNLLSAGEQGQATSLPVVPSVDAAVFETLTSLAFGSIIGTYTLLLTPGGNLRYFEIQNDTDAPIIVSLDAGTTDHWQIPLKEPRIFDLVPFGRYQSAAIHIKHTGVAPTSGEVRIMGYR